MDSDASTAAASTRATRAPSTGPPPCTLPSTRAICEEELSLSSPPPSQAKPAKTPASTRQRAAKLFDTVLKVPRCLASDYRMLGTTQALIPSKGATILLGDAGHVERPESIRSSMNQFKLPSKPPRRGGFA